MAALQRLLWLLTALTLTTQELARLNVSHKITAECGKPAVLHCNISSSHRGLSIKHMEWSLNKTSLCSVDGEGNITEHHKHAHSDFRCEYEQGRLSLILHGARPLESGDSKPYRCKLQSTSGADHKYTTVELQECCEIVRGFPTSGGQECTFSRVHPDGDVHWFHGSHNLTDEFPDISRTTKQVDRWGWLTISGYLQRESSDVPYNCSLMSPGSGRYIASTLIRSRARSGPPSNRRNGAGSQRPVRTLLCILIIVAVALK